MDPGTRGAMCVLDSNDPAHIALFDFHLNTIYDAAKWLHDQNVNVIWLEKIHAFPGMAAKSSFGFGRSYGIAMSICEIGTKGLLPKSVVPRVWQKHIGITAKGSMIKKQVAQVASTIYPAANIRGPKGGLIDGRSDALMIAHYGLSNI
jgi:hypothetical protein